jgi:hypothetical protein
MLVSPIGIGSGINRGILTGRRGIIGAGPGPGGSLQDEVASTCFHLDATDAASYSGSGQEWLNLIDTPADGTSKTDHDMWRGSSSSSSTDDPTFNGTAGDPAAYWSTDGGDQFYYKLSTIPGFLGNIHKTAQSEGFWMAFAFQRPNTGDTIHLFANANVTADRGFAFFSTGTGFGFSRFRDSTAQTTWNNSYTITHSVPHVGIVSMPGDKSIARFWVNERTARTMNSPGWTNNTDPARPTQVVGLRRAPPLGGFAPSGTRLYAIAGGNSYLDDTAAGKIFDFFNAKHGRTYA